MRSAAVDAKARVLSIKREGGSVTFTSGEATTLEIIAGVARTYRRTVREAADEHHPHVSDRDRGIGVQRRFLIPTKLDVLVIVSPACQTDNLDRVRSWRPSRRELQIVRHSHEIRQG